MSIYIHGITVKADPKLSLDEIRQVVNDVIQTQSWEGRTVDRIELVCDENWIHVYTYEKPFIKIILRKNCS